VRGVVSDRFSVGIEFVFAQVDVIAPGYAVSANIDAYRLEEPRICEEVKLRASQKLLTIIHPLLAVPKTD